MVVRVAQTLLVIAGLGRTCPHARAQSATEALAGVVEQAHASALVLDLGTGSVLKTVGPMRRGTPGSVLKPLLLQYALEHGVVTAQTEVYCRRDLHIAGRPYPCTHPKDQVVFHAGSALAESCNTWFAGMATRFTDVQLGAALDETHLSHVPVREADASERELVVLGLRDVTASPLELARAYAGLLTRLPPSGPVAQGLRDSVDFGMANPAAIAGLVMLGKTGTASDPGEAWTHGWFVGAVPRRVLVVIYVPHGDGGTAARLARPFFRAVQAGEALR